mmetsp:Transcript_46159/g.68088  ORF Transcript_46159/g.68088 Transcript_46159/m.68088 type:complete len:82 (+) Transcript_46159:103-348(+)
MNPSSITSHGIASSQLEYNLPTASFGGRRLTLTRNGNDSMVVGECSQIQDMYMRCVESKNVDSAVCTAILNSNIHCHTSGK